MLLSIVVAGMDDFTANHNTVELSRVSKTFLSLNIQYHIIRKTIIFRIDKSLLMNSFNFVMYDSEIIK